VEFVRVRAADADVICCETVLNPMEMFPHMTAAAAAAASNDNDDDDDDDMKFVFTIRFTYKQPTHQCFSIN